jgi:hypothetical protein
VRVWIVVFCLAALIATYMMFVEPPPPRRIVIASGGQHRAYFRDAQRYGEELQKEEFYHLRLHLAMLQQRLIELRAQSDPSAPERGISREDTLG